MQGTSTPVKGTFPRNLGDGANIYKEPEMEEQSLGIQQYTLPVSAGPQSSTVTFNDQIHPYHELEPNSEVMAATGHHYHLLDVCCS